MLMFSGTRKGCPYKQLLTLKDFLNVTSDYNSTW